LYFNILYFVVKNIEFSYIFVFRSEGHLVLCNLCIIKLV